MKVAVITISDRAYAGVYEDRSGPEIVRILRELPDDDLSSMEIYTTVIPDDPKLLSETFDSHSMCDVIITTGGTGIGPRDFTPEITNQWCEKMVPGIAEALRAMSLRETMSAMLSRGSAGIRGKTLVVNFPGSVKAVKSCTRFLAPQLRHAVKMMHGEGH
ncbi:MAG: MogA/MoaB family molybdenum cofactor biosynthesis protein [Spirochaetia bacterium]|nr:MogA/MoaB family molybdenum cofactor biosynthesis protein [Spirochaetia bacterium]